MEQNDIPTQSFTITSLQPVKNLNDNDLLLVSEYETENDIEKCYSRSLEYGALKTNLSSVLNISSITSDINELKIISGDFDTKLTDLTISSKIADHKITNISSELSNYIKANEEIDPSGKIIKYNAEIDQLRMIDTYDGLVDIIVCHNGELSTINKDRAPLPKITNSVSVNKNANIASIIIK